jgi:hypothetical protein
MEAAAIAHSFGVRLAPRGQPTPLGPADLHIIGIRAVHLPKLDARDISQIILAGLAGALDPVLKPGEVVCDGGSVAEFPNCRIAAIHTANHLVATPAEKAALFIETDAAAVDMESAIVRQFATPLKIPVLTIRAISDTAAEFVSPRLLRWIDSTGRPKPAAVAAGLVSRPWMIRSLIRLRNRSTLAMGNLVRVLRAYLS